MEGDWAKSRKTSKGMSDPASRIARGIFRLQFLREQQDVPIAGLGQTDLHTSFSKCSSGFSDFEHRPANNTPKNTSKAKPNDGDLVLKGVRPACVSLE